MKSTHELCDHLANAFKSFARTIAIKETAQNRAIVHILYKEGFFNSYALGNQHGPYRVPTPRTPGNVASRKIWITLKYRDGKPALNKIRPVSLPSRKIYASHDDLLAIAAARNSGTLLKAQVLGQVTIVETPYGIVELKEAIEKKVGGKVLCYAF